MEPEKAREVTSWLKKSANDLEAANTLFDAPSPKRDIVVYHCQQAVEKAHKGWHVYRDVIFPKTHDLERLLALSTSVELKEKLVVHARILTPYAVEFRYPGDLEEPDDQACREALELAAESVHLIRQIIPH